MASAYEAGAAAGAAPGTSPLVVHVNGAFHSDFGQGTAARAKRRLPGKRIVVVSVLPVDDLDTLARREASGRGRTTSSTPSVSSAAGKG